MTKYVALLRGAGPGNPNMHQKKLVAAVESLGFSNVRAVISSGNVVFEADTRDISELEKMLEKVWPEQLGFQSTTIVRSQKQLQKLIATPLFEDIKDAPASRLNVTFLKNNPLDHIKFPHHGLRFSVLGMQDNTICSVLDLSDNKTPGLFTWIDKQYGPQNTSRTYKTVQRILAAMK